MTLDLVSFGQIGHITMEFLPRIRARVQRELGLDPANLVFNVNHGHGVPCDDVEERTFGAIAAAAASMVPVALGTGRGHEDRIQENRRMFLKDGSESDVRGAYALPPDEEMRRAAVIHPSPAHTPPQLRRAPQACPASTWRTSARSTRRCAG